MPRARVCIDAAALWAAKATARGAATVQSELPRHIGAASRIHIDEQQLMNLLGHLIVLANRAA